MVYESRNASTHSPGRRVRADRPIALADGPRETPAMAWNGPRYLTDVAGLSAEMLEGGFFEGWFAAPSTHEHLALLQNSTHAVVAVEDDRVVGFVNALSDRVLSAYIPLLEVLPRLRGSGIGRELVRRLLDEVGPLYMIGVMCDDDVFPFYKPLGFIKAGGGVLRNYDWTSRGEAT